MKKQPKEPRFYNGIQIDSYEEMWVLQYLEELMENGFVSKIERAKSFELSTGLINFYTETKQLKTKTKEIEKEQKLLSKHIYTPEFLVIWSTKGAQLFVDLFSKDGKMIKPFIGSREFPEGVITYIEVKPEHDKYNMTRLFNVNKTWMYQRHNIYINLVQPLQLFEKTFVPKKFLTTPTGKQRVIHIPVRSLDDYIITIQ